MPSITHVAKSSLVCLPDCSYALIIRTRRRRVISRLWTAYCPLSTQIPSRPPTAFLSRNSVRGGGGGNLRDVPVVGRWASPKRLCDRRAAPPTAGGSSSAPREHWARRASAVRPRPTPSEAGYASEAATQSSIAARGRSARQSWPAELWTAPDVRPIEQNLVLSIWNICI